MCAAYRRRDIALKDKNKRIIRQKCLLQFSNADLLLPRPGPASTTATFPLLLLVTPAGARGFGVLVGCVGSVLSHRGSGSHLPPYSSQPDPYPQPSPAQQARCLIPSKRLPAVEEGVGGRSAGGDKGRGGAVGVGELHSKAPFDPFPWPGGADGTDSIVSARPASSSSFISRTDSGGERRDRRGGRGAGGWFGK